MLAVIALAMNLRLGAILVSGPTHITVMKAAERIYLTSASVVKRHNKGRSPQARRRHLVVHVYSREVEMDTFMHILQHPDDVANAGKDHPMFQLPYSRTYWLMVLLGAAAIGRLEDHDAKALHEMRESFLSQSSLAPLFRRIRREVSWEEYLREAAKEGGHRDQIAGFLDQLLLQADFACATPACTENDPGIRNWKVKTARGLIVDDAASMGSADLACVWGNCLLPCFLVGDPKQQPRVMTSKERDADGYLFNPLCDNGRISAFEMLLASGYPAYQLHVQLRMAPAMFDAVGKEFYPSIPISYAPWDKAADHDAFETGRLLEEFAQNRYPDLEPPKKAGTFSPFFINCVDSHVFSSSISLSRRCPGQTDVALDFVSELTADKGIDPARITIISLYAANAQHAESRRKSEYETLSRMPPVCTIDDYQGQENDIIVVVFGTNKLVGVELTGEAQRLNVLLTRARCGLVLVGDLGAVGRTTGRDIQEAFGLNGKRRLVNIKSIRNIYKGLKRNGRVATVGKDAKAREGELDEKVKKAKGGGKKTKSKSKGKGKELGEEDKGEEAGLFMEAEEDGATGKKRKAEEGDAGPLPTGKKQKVEEAGPGTAAAGEKRKAQDSKLEEGEIRETSAPPPDIKLERKRQKRKEKMQRKKARKAAEKAAAAEEAKEAEEEGKEGDVDTDEGG